MTDATAQKFVRPDQAYLSADRLDVWLAATVIFLSPFNVLRVQALYFTAADLATLAAFLVLLGRGRISLMPLGGFTPVWVAGYFLLTGGLLLGSIANDRLPASLVVIAQYSFAMLVLPTIVCKSSTRDCHRMLMVWVLSIVVVMLHGAWLVNYAADPPLRLVSISGRLRGVVERSNEAATLAAIAATILFYLSAERMVLRWPTIIGVCILLYGVLLTGSNTGTFVAAAGVLSLSVLYRSGRHAGTMAVFVALCTAVFVVGGDKVLPEAFTERVLSALTDGDINKAGTLEDRMLLTLEGWRLSAEHVLIGLGAEGFREVSVHGAPVHNTYILLLVEGGILSLLGLGIILAGGAGLGIILLMSPRTRGRGALTLTIILIFTAMLNGFPHIYARFLHVPLLLILALAVADGADEVSTGRG